MGAREELAAVLCPRCSRPADKHSRYDSVCDFLPRQVAYIARLLDEARREALRDAAASYLHTYPEIRDDLMDRADRIGGEDHAPGPDWTCSCGYDYFGGSAGYSWQLYEAHLPAAQKPPQDGP